MKKLVVILCLIISGCSNYSTEPPPIEDGLVFRMLIESDNRIDVGDCLDATLYRMPSSRQYDHRVEVGSFRDFWEANEMKICFREAGLINVYILAYEDGVRVPLNPEV